MQEDNSTSKPIADQLALPEEAKPEEDPWQYTNSYDFMADLAKIIKGLNEEPHILVFEPPYL